MSPRSSSHLRGRIALIAGATVFFTLVASGASALWSTSATVSSTARAATVGITQTLATTTTASTDLAHTYSSGSLIAASAVTLVNTGNRSATYTLSLLAFSTASGLPAAVSVKIAPVVAVADCSRTATLSSPTTGVLSTTTALTKSAAFAAAGTVILCVQTSMALAAVTTYAEKSMSIALSASTTLGPWTASAGVISVTQDVASAQLYSTDRSGRYTIFTANGCIEAYSTTKLINTGSSSCSTSAGQWRLTKDSATGNYYIAQGTNGSSTGSGWSFVAASGLSVLATAATAAQRWAVEVRADGLYRFRNESSGLCAVQTTVGADNPATSTRPLVQLATCADTSAAQGFTLTLQGNPVPATPNSMTCNGNGTNYIQLVWPGAAGYEQEIRYKFYVNNIFVKDVTDGYNPYVQLFRPADLAIATYGSGTLVVRAEQSIAGSAYVVSATGTMYIEPGTNNLRCAP